MSAVIESAPLGFPWATLDPFLFCVHHKDDYPQGNEKLGPDASLDGRQIGSDFVIKDGWRMYHGDVVPGFPQHPHRGFETVTLARSGYIDHSDSLGATARFGHGDAQWMTAGSGIVHCEMFPLVNQDAPNPTELFQIWLNLPAKHKMVDPHFTMIWSENIGHKRIVDSQGRGTTVTVVAGRFQDVAPPSPPPKSYAANPDSDVAIWTLKMDPGARCTLPGADPSANRVLYFFVGSSITVGGQHFTEPRAIVVQPDAELELENGETEAELLLLQGCPIGEPVVNHGPFVMNSTQEIQQAIADYRRTGFGGWPWPSSGPVHDRQRGRFALHADGRLEDRAKT